jgi:hypothetical protein
VTPEEEILKSSRVVAMVGASDNVDRPSNQVFRYLRANGYKVIPVNPVLKELMGEKAYPDLISIPEEVDVVDIFRKAEDVPAIVEEAIKIGARVVWMQEDIVNEAAAQHAREAGLKVVMNKCMRKQHLAM